MLTNKKPERARKQAIAEPIATENVGLLKKCSSISGSTRVRSIRTSSSKEIAPRLKADTIAADPQDSDAPSMTANVVLESNKITSIWPAGSTRRTVGARDSGT